MKKETTPKQKKESVALMSYSIKLLIATGPYSNIQPEFTVSAPTLDEAYAFCSDHIDMLHAKYFSILERKPQVSPLPAPKVNGPVVGDQTVGYKSEAFIAAENLINASRSVEADIIIQGRVENSTKLAQGEKAALLELINQKEY